MYSWDIRIKMTETTAAHFILAVIIKFQNNLKNHIIPEKSEWINFLQIKEINPSLQNKGIRDIVIIPISYNMSFNFPEF
jgi:hypothetical protein